MRAPVTTSIHTAAGTEYLACHVRNCLADLAVAVGSVSGLGADADLEQRPFPVRWHSDTLALSGVVPPAPWALAKIVTGVGSVT